MKLEDGVRLVYRDEETRKIAEPILEELPITLQPHHPGCIEIVNVTPGSSTRFRDTCMDNSVSLRSSYCTNYLGLEKLDPERYEVMFHSSEMTYVIIADKKRQFEILLRAHSA